VADSFVYDAFISCSDADEEFVEWLRARLERAGLKTLTSYELRGGLPKYVNKEEAIRASAHVVPILSPAWVQDEWKQLDTAIATAVDPAAKARKIIPLLLADCEIPKYLEPLESRDFRRVAGRELQARLLIADLLPPPTRIAQTPPTLTAKVESWVLRHPVAALLTAILLVVCAAALLGIPKVEGWRKTDLDAVGAWRLARFDDTLLVATRAISGCDATDTGLWQSVDNGDTWSAVPMPLLKIPSGGCELAAIYRFAATSQAPRSIYAPTTNVGLLQSDLSGKNWSQVKSETLPLDLFSMAVLAGAPETIFVSGATDGVYRWRAGEADWTRLDGKQTCQRGDGFESLPQDVARKAHLATNGELVYVAGPQTSYNPPAILPRSGIYVSADGGNCWTQIHDADKRWMYTALATNSNLPDQVFFGAIERDAWSPLNPPHQIVAKLDRQTKGVTTLWDERNILYGVELNLYVEPQGKFWYLSNATGQLIRGSAEKNQTGLVGSVLGLVTCRFLRACFSDVAADSQSEIPLLMADQSVYRWSTVSWLQALFP